MVTSPRRAGATGDPARAQNDWRPLKLRPTKYFRVRVLSSGETVIVALYDRGAQRILGACCKLESGCLSGVGRANNILAGYSGGMRLNDGLGASDVSG